MTLLGLIGFLLLAALALLFARTLMVERTENQRIFAAGTLPQTPPDGFLRGTVGTGKAPGGWLGKKFNASTNTGINILEQEGKQVERFPFRTYAGTGLRDRMPVYKIDYNSSANPWWVRAITDEIVEVSPGKYLGKVHIRLVPGIAFTVGFFRLET